ncbi:Aste57867_13310 [Aphanomyces stellatus]|uniref:Aste57867_13310 protein n=1 Tax=Aphanomyces stellatus TaxID=120398 RepID=A0A485KXS8_9STRA|nr:hypothetical protein As57867_013261 [Aphanomyces stellatus]VFT90149.1 Aste57867_13310 [Aphanomyces stellatus]
MPAPFASSSIAGILLAVTGFCIFDIALGSSSRSASRAVTSLHASTARPTCFWLARAPQPSSHLSFLSRCVIGLLESIAPLIQFILGVAIYHEPISKTMLAGFVVLWISMGVFAVDSFRQHKEDKVAADWSLNNDDNPVAEIDVPIVLGLADHQFLIGMFHHPHHIYSLYLHGTRELVGSQGLHGIDPVLVIERDDVLLVMQFV